MRFLLDAEQRAFADSLAALLKAADTPSVVRDWSRGEHTSGRALWSRIAELGVFALAAPEAYGGLGPRPVELAVAFVELGRHAVPGPLAETAAAITLLTEAKAGTDTDTDARRLLPSLLDGTRLATIAPQGSYALDGDAADIRLSLTPDGPRLAPGHGPVRPSLDPARRRTLLSPGGELLTTATGTTHTQATHTEATDTATTDPQATLSKTTATAHHLTLARLTTAAQALGVGEALLERTVAYVRQRRQFGVPVGSFQAVKHRLADAKLALEFARPLVFGAALTLDRADVAAAKACAGEAAYATARAALQCHGAIGYTAEYDLSLWLTKARALRTAWGDPDTCRAEILDARRARDATRRAAG